MLDKENPTIQFNDEGKVCGVMSAGETARAPMVICDPSYAGDKVKKVGQVIKSRAHKVRHEWLKESLICCGFSFRRSYCN